MSVSNINPVHANKPSGVAVRDGVVAQEQQVFTRKPNDVVSARSNANPKDKALIPPAILALALDAQFPAPGRYAFPYGAERGRLERFDNGLICVSCGDRVVKIMNGLIVPEQGDGPDYVHCPDPSAFLSAARHAQALIPAQAAPSAHQASGV